MTVLSVWLPEEIAVTPESIVPDAQIPLLPASRIGSGVFHPDRIPQVDASKVSTGVLDDERIPETVARVTEVETFVASEISTHEQATDPHPQYVRSEDLDTHTSSAGNSYHIPSTGIADSEVDDDAAIAWSKISKSGAVASDVGAAATNHTHSELAIVSATAPSSPSTNTRWFDTTDNQMWFWNGTYWLSEQRYFLPANYTNLVATAGLFSIPVNTAYDYWFESLRVSAQVQVGTYDSSNNWAFRLIREAAFTASVDATLQLPNQTISVAEKQLHTLTINLHRDTSALSVIFFRLEATKIGSAPNLNTANAFLLYRLVKA